MPSILPWGFFTIDLDFHSIYAYKCTYDYIETYKYIYVYVCMYAIYIYGDMDVSVSMSASILNFLLVLIWSTEPLTTAYGRQRLTPWIEDRNSYIRYRDESRLTLWLDSGRPEVLPTIRRAKKSLKQWILCNQHLSRKSQHVFPCHEEFWNTNIED